MKPKENLLLSLIVGAVIAAAINTGFDPVKFAQGAPNIGVLISEMMQLESRLLSIAFWSILETLQMAFVGTLIGAAISIPLSLLAARNLNSKFVYAPVRAVLAGIRTFPSILWALSFIIIVGLDPFAGILSIIMYTVGFMSKLQYESIEAIDPDPVEVVGAMGASKTQLIRYVVLPESAPHLLSQLLYMFEYNVRQTSILGIVGAGGIGFYIIEYIKFFQYGKAMVFMLVVLATVLVIDWINTKIRDRYIVQRQSGK
ncbi:MAG: phosphonate ABC transporter, permease protein PhnE [Nitrososphaerales archaeon]